MHKPASMKSLFDEDAYKEVLHRVNQITGGHTGKWGRMDAARMLHHCQQPLAVALGRKPLKKPNFIVSLLMRTFKSSLYNDKAWKQNLPTAREYRVEGEYDFQTEKTGLIGLIHDFYGEKDRADWEPHVVFGSFTPEQWGQMQYKHLDHHLRQFGL